MPSNEIAVQVDGATYSEILKLANGARTSSVTLKLSTGGSAAAAGDLTKHSFGCTKIAIDPASDIGAIMHQMRQDIDPKDLAGDGLEVDAHVTVRYGILPDAKLNNLRRYLRSLQPFSITFGMTSMFPPSPSSDNAAVIKVDITSPALQEINAAVAQNCAFRPATFDYTPHATIAYVDPDIAFKYIAEDCLEGKQMQVNAITIAMPGRPDESVPLLGEQVDNSVKLAKLAKRAESPEITQARQVMESAVKHFFDKTAAALAAHVRGQHEKLAKAAGPADLPPIQWDALVPDLFGSLNTIARTQAGRAVAELKVDDSKMLSDVNTVASDWANERAAELVGMRRTASGRLIQNPKAEWTISTKTRDDLRGIVTEAFEKKTAMSDLADQIQNAGVFSDYRAHLIAATETNRAANQGNLAGWRVSGQVEQLEWTLSADHDDKDGCDCGENADGSPYPIDDCPELPAHPGCQCALVVAQLVGQEPD